ncbi:putative formate transporter [Fusarium oxysporum f. sp. rapae]|uniref:Putative formate transporter n=1 Tax=Fusarium oxysporum f. sp. rapae TaxID=485398 RepID=A0A8J5TRH1_FUSOX|nr:putative formate transporter [Fusarium oxysporum f. sp. rapae]
MGNPVLVDVVNLAAYTPTETTELVSRTGVQKGNMRPDKVFISAVSAGCLLSFGCAVSLIALTAPWYQENAPGLIKIIGALVFPLGLVMVVLTGADLFTATTMYTLVAVLHRRLPVRKMLLHWFLCFWGNLSGSLFMVAIIFGCCNWLVCLACFLSIQAKDLNSKVIGIWWPIFAFVSLGLDHVVANMFFIPLGIWLHTPGLTIGVYIWKGKFPGAPASS